MKIFKNIALIGLLMVTAYSCTEYVDYDPAENYEIVADIYFESSDDYESAVVGTYDPLQWMYLNILIGDIASDNSLCGGESATDVVGLQEIDDMTHYASNDNLTSIWTWCYEGINRANYLEENKEKLEFDGKAALYGEVYFLRAYYYFELVKFFGDVPLFTEYRLTASDSGTLERSEASVVYAQIETDLLNAIDALPTTVSQSGRVTKYAAQALLGKVYLYQDKFTESAEVLENVIGKYTLVSDYASQFLSSGENGTESVFEVQHSSASEWWDWGYTPQGTEGNYGIIHNGPRGFSGPTYASGWSFNVPTEDLYNSYDENDTRRDASILDMEAFAEANDASYTEGYEHTGYYNHKYIPRAGESDAQTELNYGTNYRSIRYADVLLMAAEANNRGGVSDTKAQEYLNEVRRRAFGDTDHDITATGSTLTDAIWAERNFELAMEGHRFFDLVRTGEAADVIDGFVEGKHEVFPIPQQEIDISNLTQNDGY
ncbi:RagB/SusD family nutrient uptake outer membrane protein [Maribacter polysaccharolyticus]|uniref:RagB/SusD family nutrient uptake outer membrane protein n=1 Tax=Maribacter polysaccharolyticus TaxID=3020831 RepID=UPI00237F9DF8|nr:RagB/SusD family nutrient uptake outer membrane protein [Maribacter polysaccharolyticus]MDE3743798.1 RagB/SusD family nutrient uptake outer membrane protein [Maribacter polysaccharolyticus]